MATNTPALPSTNLKGLKKMIAAFYKNDIPLYLWGRPSTGKTSIVREFAKEECERINRSRIAQKLKPLTYSEDKFGAEFFTLKVITLSQFDSPDLRGMPEINGEPGHRVTEFIPTSELPRSGRGIIFFDEMNMADDTTRAAAYQLILEGRYGSLPPVLDENGKPAYYRLAASNNEDDFCQVNTLQLALLRRFSHVQVTPETEEVLEYYIRAGIDPRVIGYLKTHQTDLWPAKWEENLVTRKANPFPSTWENAAKLISDLTDGSAEGYADMTRMVSACIGADLASKFVAHCKLVDAVDIDEIIKDPEKGLGKINKMQEKASLLYSITLTIANMWREQKKGLEPKKLIGVAKHLSPDYQVVFIRSLFASGKERLSMFMKEETRKDFTSMMSKMQGLMDEFNDIK